MADIEYWIQLENRPWDMSPHNIDRMDGQTIEKKMGVKPTEVPWPGPAGTRTMNFPINDGTVELPDKTKRWKPVDALILRRYKQPQLADFSDAWTVPDDRKVNPWDLNEHNPGESGTRGTIPGPVIECNVGDTVIVHFKNADGRVGKSVQTRTHSLHPHGFVFQANSDGAYPLSPVDRNQATGAEDMQWVSLGVTGKFKQGDRVPPGASFIYTWKTIGWPSTAGVWLYHDHSICDMDNVELGAIGIIVIHNPADAQNEVDIRLLPAEPTKLDPLKVVPALLDPAFLPGGSPNGSPTQRICFPFPRPFPVLDVHLAKLGDVADPMHSHGAAPAQSEPKKPEGKQSEAKHAEAKYAEPQDEKAARHDDKPHELVEARALKINNLVFELNPELTLISRFCLSHYRTPPTKALYLQLYHTIRNGPTCINGRQWLGNTPTFLAGPNTRMRFGVVGMGSMFHTFHIHGHRWIIPGPDGNTPNVIQGNPQVMAVSQFEDTRIFGPANSFVFTIAGQSGSFMRAGGPSPNDALGEWHMHCHVLNHMMTGMMGSLLIVAGGELSGGLPVGVPCPVETGGGTQTKEVHLTTASAFSPKDIMINAGDTVTWMWDNADEHTVTSDTGAWPNSGSKSGGPPFPTFPNTFLAPGTYKYHCQFHGGPNGVGMSGSVMVM